MKIVNIFKIPRSDLEDRWWHRLFKVFVVVSTIVVIIFSFLWSSEVFDHYYVFSYYPDYDTYDNFKERDWSKVDKTYFDKINAVQAMRFAYDDDFRRYIDELDRSSGGSIGVYQILEDKGYFKDAKVKDLQTNFKGKYYKILFIVLVPILYYLVLLNVFYRLVAYILAGKKKNN